MPLFTSTFAGLTICCSCWFGCCKPSYQPQYFYPGPRYAPAVIYPQPYSPGTVRTIPYPVPAMGQTGVPAVGAMPAATEKSLYERLGGEVAIKAVIDDFVARAAADPKVNFTRKGTDKEWKPTPENVEHLKKELVDLVGMLSGGPQKYTGRTMKEVHAGMKISQAEFDALAGDLKATLDKFKVPAREQGELLKAVAGTAPDIVEKK